MASSKPYSHPDTCGAEEPVQAVNSRKLGISVPGQSIPCMHLQVPNLPDNGAPDSGLLCTVPHHDAALLLKAARVHTQGSMEGRRMCRLLQGDLPLQSQAHTKSA